MINLTEWSFDGRQDQIVARTWRDESAAPRYVAVLVHEIGVLRVLLAAFAEH